jgi:hypothetical protein
MWLGFDPRLDLQKVKKVVFFCNPASGGLFTSTAIEIIDRLKFALAKDKVFPHLVTLVLVGCGIRHAKDL